jgi:integrase
VDFRFVSPLTGKTREMGLGTFRDVTVEEAREARDAARLLVRKGIDPIELRSEKIVQQKLTAAKAMTFDACASAYIRAHEPAWRNAKHRQAWRNSIATYASPIFGNLAVTAIDINLVMEAIEPIWVVKPETAGRVRGRIESILDWATMRGFREGENPARWRGRLSILLPPHGKVRKVKHHAAMDYVALPKFMKALALQPGMAAIALRFVIYTAARTGEVLNAEWSEVDLDAKVWTVPAERMKGGRTHRVPLPPAAIALLKSLPKKKQISFFQEPAASRFRI